MAMLAAPAEKTFLSVFSDTNVRLKILNSTASQVLNVQKLLDWTWCEKYKLVDIAQNLFK